MEDKRQEAPQEITILKEDAEKMVHLAEHTKVLLKHPSFIAVITEEYLTNYRDDLIRELNTIPSEEINQKSLDLQSDIKGINDFHGYLQRTLQLGAMVQRDVGSELETVQ